jgi:hypothetical protein
MGAESEGNTRGMGHATTFKLTEDPSTEGDSWAGIPSLSMQQLWFSLQRLEWSTLVMVPADREMSAMDIGRPLYEVGRLAMGDKLRLLDAREVNVTRTAALILDMTGGSSPRAGGTPFSDRVLVIIESILSHPSGVPVALAADAAVLCVEMGKTSISAARETLQILGAQRFVGCITLPPP